MLSRIYNRCGVVLRTLLEYVGPPEATHTMAHLLTVYAMARTASENDCNLGAEKAVQMYGAWYYTEICPFLLLFAAVAIFGESVLSATLFYTSFVRAPCRGSFVGQELGAIFGSSV